MKVYLDTTISSYAASLKETPETRVSKKLFSLMKKKELLPYVSFVTLQELKDTKDTEKRNRLLKTLNSVSPNIIRPSKQIRLLATKYVASGIIPKKYQADALHIAAAVISGVTTIVSWNLRHMVNIFVKRKVNSINIAEGYPQVDLVTPWEIIPPEGE